MAHLPQPSQLAIFANSRWLGSIRAGVGVVSVADFNLYANFKG